MYDAEINRFVYQYHHIDDIEYSHKENPEAKIDDVFVKDIFKKHGWEGDGDVTTIWLPSFFLTMTKLLEDTYGM